METRTPGSHKHNLSSEGPKVGMSDSDSEFEVPNLPQVSVNSEEPVEEIQRREIEALRRQVLEKSAENAILTGRMRDTDEMFSRRLNEQVIAQSLTREAQISEIEAIKREMSGLRKKNSFLEMENKALASKRKSGVQSPRHNSLGDGFLVKRRKPDQDSDIVPVGQQFRVAISSCTLTNQENALKQLSAEVIASTLAASSAEAAANYLIESLLKLEVYRHPACLKLLEAIHPFLEVPQVIFEPLLQSTKQLLNTLEPLPRFDTPGNIYLDRRVCYSLTSILYALDFLILCAKPPPYTLVEKLLRNSNPVLCLRGYKLLEALPNQITECNVMSDSSHTSHRPALEHLFGGLLDNRPLDATVIPEFSHKLLHLQVSKRELKIVSKYLAIQTRSDLDLHIVRSIAVKQTIEPNVWYKVVDILLSTNEHSSQLVKTCMRFIWGHSPLPTSINTSLYSTILTTRLSRIASLTNDPDVSFWCQDVLTQFISPHEDEVLRDMMTF